MIEWASFASVSNRNDTHAVRKHFFRIVAVAAICGAALAHGASAEEPTRPQEPTREELQSVDSSLETVRKVCSSALAAVLEELRTRFPGIQARQSGGRSKRNDYRNYQWISVKFGDREYLVCAHHGNLDTRTGNPHTQMGRFQFWRCEGPNGPHSRDENGVWRYRFDNEDQTLPRTCVWDEDFSASALVDRFVAVLRRHGEDPGDDQGGGGLQSAVGTTNGNAANEAIENVRTVEAKAMAAVVAELRSRHPDWFVRSSHGNSRVNDYRCYQWITIRPYGDDRAFWITMMFNDQDPYTGNTHTQFGRIQFWRDIVRGEYEDGSGRKSELGPHTRDDGGWRFRSDKQWESMPRLHLYSPEYSTARVADLFEVFLASQTSPSTPTTTQTAP